MTVYGVRRVLEVTVESLRPYKVPPGAAAMYQLSNSGARTFDGAEWVPMAEMGDSGVQFSVQHLLSQEEMRPFFDTAIRKWEGSLRLLVHVSATDSKVGVWSGPGLRCRPTLSTDHGPDMATAEVTGYEDELADKVTDVVLSMMVMES